jgi:hypothetical protein
MTAFSTTEPSIAEVAVLPDQDGYIVWPPRKQIDPALLAPVPAEIRYSADWWKVGEAEKARELARMDKEAEEAELAKRRFYGQAG